MKISLCLITKNEEVHLQTCIDSVRSIVDEIIVVDTGSNDDTVKIAESLGAKVYTFEWVNDFSKARNYALSKATGDWVIFLDADEYISDKSVNHIRQCIVQADKQKKMAILGELINIDDDLCVIDITKSVRIMKKHKDVAYIKPIHERIAYKGSIINALSCTEQIKIYHIGYSANNMAAKNKKERNLEILLEREKSGEKDSETCYYIAQTYWAYHDYEKVLEYTKKAELYNNLTMKHVYSMNKRYQLDAAVELGKTTNEMQLLYQEALKQSSDYPDYDYTMAKYYLNQKQYDEVLKYFAQCLQKLQIYEGIAEVQSISNLESIYEIISKIHIYKGNFRDAVISLVNVLKYNRYNVYAAYNLLKILGTNEGTSNIYNFLMRLYDLANVKDTLFLMQIVKKHSQHDLLMMLETHLDKDGVERWKVYQSN